MAFFCVQLAIPLSTVLGRTSYPHLLFGPKASSAFSEQPIHLDRFINLRWLNMNAWTTLLTCPWQRAVDEHERAVGKLHWYFAAVITSAAIHLCILACAVVVRDVLEKLKTRPSRPVAMGSCLEATRRTLATFIERRSTSSSRRVTGLNGMVVDEVLGCK